MVENKNTLTINYMGYELVNYVINNSSLKAELDVLKEELSKKDSIIEQLQNENDSLRNSLQNANKEEN